MDGVEARIQKLLFSAAKHIVSCSSRYRSGKRIMAENKLMRDATAITAALADGIESEIERYALAACSRLGIPSAGTEAFLTSEIYGHTSRQRTEKYLAHFAEDIVRMAKAGILLGYAPQKILSAVRTGYKEPYLTSVITKACKKNISIATPSYGKGIYRSAYRNIIRNARQMVALAWGRAQQQYGKRQGAIGFRVFRGSSFPCPVCDAECEYTHTFRDPFPPFHVNCVCGIQFIYKQDDMPQPISAP